MKFKLTLYQEIYTDYEVEAENEEQAREKVCNGEAEEIDTTVKESEILECEKVI